MVANSRQPEKFYAIIYKQNNIVTYIAENQQAPSLFVYPNTVAGTRQARSAPRELTYILGEKYKKYMHAYITNNTKISGKHYVDYNHRK